MFENLEEKQEIIYKILVENQDKSSEEIHKILFDENGLPRESVFGELYKNEINEFISRKNNVNNQQTDFTDLSRFSDDEVYDNLPKYLFDDGNLNEIRMVAHIAYEFDMEFANGGVSQYFANTRGEHTLELAECLEKIGATRYAKVCDEFIKRHNIKPSDFDDNIKNYFKIAESMYPYEELESAIEEFYMTDLLQDYIVKYVRENAADIV